MWNTEKSFRLFPMLLDHPETNLNVPAYDGILDLKLLAIYDIRKTHVLRAWVCASNLGKQLLYLPFWPLTISHSGGWSPYSVHSARQPLLAYCTCPGWLWWWRIWWNEDWQGKPKYSEKTGPQCHFVHHKSHLLDPGSNPGRRDGKPATNRLSRSDHSLFLCFLCKVSDFQKKNYASIFLLPLLTHHRYLFCPR
jgi:hypothetical protein